MFTTISLALFYSLWNWGTKKVCSFPKILFVAEQTIMTCARLLHDCGRPWPLCWSGWSVVTCCVWYHSLAHVWWWGVELPFPGDKGTAPMMSSQSCRASLSWSITLLINPYIKQRGTRLLTCSCCHVFTGLINDSAGRSLKSIWGKWLWARFFQTFYTFHSFWGCPGTKKWECLQQQKPCSQGLWSQRKQKVFSEEIGGGVGWGRYVWGL